MSTTPATIELEPGTYAGPIPAGYQLVVVAAGAARLQRPEGPRPLTGLAAATQTTPATSGGASGILARIALGTLLGLAAVTIGRGIQNGPSDPSPVVPPSPVEPPGPHRPNWWPPDRPVPEIGQVAAGLAPQEWRPLAWAPGWEGFGREVGGEFAVTTWRPMAPALPATAASSPDRGACPSGNCPR